MKLYAISENHLFSKAYSKGKKCPCRYVTVYVLRDYHADRLRRENPLKFKINRIGITVSKKVGGAVTRNRVKRIIREAYSFMEKSYILKKGFLIVIVARELSAAAGTSAAAGRSKDVKTQMIIKDLLYAFGKLDMIVQPQNVEPSVNEKIESEGEMP